MMLSFDNLNLLSHHHHYLQQLLGQKQFFFVGGLIRDLLLNRSTNVEDVDITLGGQPEDIKQLIKNSGQKFSFFDTEKYGTMTVIPHSSSDDARERAHYEITPFRTETTYSDGRHPDTVTRSDSLVADSQRRDFRINCLYYCRLGETSDSPVQPAVGDTDSGEARDQELFFKSLSKSGYFRDEATQTLILQDHGLIESFQNSTLDQSLLEHIIHIIIDPWKGIQDLCTHTLQAVGDPDLRFQEDALRLIRALRFCIALECDIEKTTWTSLQKNAHLIRKIAKERIKTELDKVFAGNNPFGFVSLLASANMLKWIFPKLYDNRGVHQPIRYHPFDVYTHSLLVLYHLQQLSEDKLLRYAALYHDVGKVEQYTSYYMKLDEESIRDIFAGWLNHSVCGAEFAQEDFKRLGASNQDIATIARYVLHHMKPGEIARGGEQYYKKKVRKLVAEAGPEMTKNLFLLTIADVRGQYNPLQAANVGSIETLIGLVDEIMEEEGRFSMKDLVVDGNILMKELQIAPGPELGRLLHKAYDWVLEDLSRNDKAIILGTIENRIKQGK